MVHDTFPPFPTQKKKKKKKKGVLWTLRHQLNLRYSAA